LIEIAEELKGLTDSKKPGDCDLLFDRLILQLLVGEGLADHVRRGGFLVDLSYGRGKP
jgi:hypothetical protein